MPEPLRLYATLASVAFLIAVGTPAACDRALSSVSADAPSRVPDGVWGSTGVRLDVNGSSVSIEFDCAHGTLQAPLTLDAQHRFSVAGAFVREHPGPQRDEEPPAQDARYSGQVAGDTLTLTVRAGEDTLGPFALTHEQPGRLRKCL